MSDVQHNPPRVLELIQELLVLQMRHDSGTPLVDELSERFAELATIEPGGRSLFVACCAWAKVITTAAEQTDPGPGDVICEVMPIDGVDPRPEDAAAGAQFAALVTAVGASDYPDALNLWHGMEPKQAIDVALLVLQAAAGVAKVLAEEADRG